MKFQKKFAALALTAAAMTATPAIADTGSKTGEFNVRIKLEGTCELLTVNSGKTSKITAETDVTSGADIDFGTEKARTGSPELAKSNVGSNTSGIQVNCSKNTPFKIALEPQNTPSTDGSGSMEGITAGNTDKIAYQLYQPTVTGTGTGQVIGAANSGNKWGKDTNALSLYGQGFASPVMLPVFAKVPAGELDKFIDTYQDRVTVTLSW